MLVETRTRGEALESARVVSGLLLYCLCGVQVCISPAQMSRARSCLALLLCYSNGTWLL